MPTLVTRTTRAPAPARPVGRSEARVDERVRLDRPHLGGSELVRAFIEDTSGLAHALEATPPSPRLGLRIADRSSLIALEFALESVERRENSLHKIDTLFGVQHRFRAGLAAEAELYAERELDAAMRHQTLDIARLAL
jgi:hypothetical protein